MKLSKINPLILKALRYLFIVAAVITLFFSAFFIWIVVYMPYVNRIDIEKKALAGDPISQRTLGYFYELGGVRVFGYGKFKQDNDKAIYWFETAAKNGDVKAAYSLGYFYENNFSGTKNPEALRWYINAANHGSIDADKRLFLVYSTGQLGQNIDAKQSAYWLKMSKNKSYESRR